MKKIYNPFKLFGSWFGAIVFGLLSLSLASLCRIWGTCIMYRLVILVSTSIFVGFILGWSSHVIIRYLLELLQVIYYKIKKS